MNPVRLLIFYFHSPFPPDQEKPMREIPSFYFFYCDLSLISDGFIEEKSQLFPLPFLVLD